MRYICYYISIYPTSFGDSWYEATQPGIRIPWSAIILHTLVCCVATGGRRKLNRVTSVGDLRFPSTENQRSGERVLGGRVSGSLERGRDRSSVDESRASSRGSSHRESGGGSSSSGGGGGGVRKKLSMSGGSSEGHRKVRHCSKCGVSARCMCTYAFSAVYLEHVQALQPSRVVAMVRNIDYEVHINCNVGVVL